MRKEAQMNYKYIFDKEKCWWKDVCRRYNTKECSGCCIRYMKMHYLTSNALLTEAQQHPSKLEPDNIDYPSFMRLLEIKDDILNFVNSGKNLLIYSNNTGNGKTQWSLKLMLRYFSLIWSTDSFSVRGLFINVSRMCNALKDSIFKDSEYIEHIKENIYKADLVIWDDIGLKSLTPYEHDYLYSFINLRIESNKSNIFTSNLTNDAFKDAIGDRLYSRIIGCSEAIIFKGSDKRGVK